MLYFAMSVLPLKNLVVLIGTIAVILLTFLITTVSLIFLPYQWLVQLIVRVLRPDLVSIVKGASNVMFCVNTGSVPTANISIHMIIVGARAITVEEVRKRVEKYILNQRTQNGVLVYAKLKQVLTSFMGYRFFKFVESFDLADHVRSYDHTGELALPTNRFFSEADLKRLSGQLSSKPWPVGRSNWEILVVDNFKSDDNYGDELKTLLLFRINHGFADGFCVQRLLTKIADGSPDPQKFVSRRQLSSTQRALKAMILPLKMVWDTAVQMEHLMADGNQWTLDLNKEEPRELMSTFSKQYPVETIKEIKNEFKVPYTAILLSALSTGIYKIMRQAGQEIPKTILCVTPLPKPNHPGGMTNHLAGGFMVLPIFENATTSNIKLMSAHFQSAMQSTALLLTDFWLNMLSVLPVPLVRISYKIVAPQMALSVMPVITEPVTYGGRELRGTVNVVGGLSFPARQGALVAMGGTNGMQRISVILDESVFPYRKAFSCLGPHMEQEIESMYERATAGRSMV